MKEGILILIMLVVLCVALFGTAVGLANMQCEQQTASIGYNHKFGIFSGCMIETEPGIWIPLTNWRSFGD
jgi:hypothetical protein